MPAADLILKNINAITLDVQNPSATLVAIRGDRILWVGGDGDLESLTGPGTRVVDGGGRTLVPGFTDAHCHMFSYIRQQLTVDLRSPAIGSIADIKAAVLREVRVTPPGQWINGSGYSDFDIAERRHPTRWDLDEVSPDHPVIVSHRSLHACVLNSRALARSGITIETPEPPGASIGRDTATGEPNGLLFDMLGYIRYRVMPPLADSELARGITAANGVLVSMGITSLQDATVTNNVERWNTYRRFQDNGRLKSRIYMMTGLDQMASFGNAGLSFRSGSDSLRMGGLKIVLGEASGRLFPAQGDLDAYVMEAHRTGCQLAIHAVQPATVEAAVSALEAAVTRFPGQRHRHRIEHCAECPPTLFQRVTRLGVVISTQPAFLYYSGDRYLAQVPQEGIRWLYRVRSFTDSGLVVAGSSDTPVIPNNPLVGVYAAVTRKSVRGNVLYAEERVLPLEALAMYTKNAAYASYDEQVKGSITVGKYADMVLLSDDLTRVEAEEIKDIKVVTTIIGGEVVWEA
jgi:predicted amidohydrolase YtcJ